VILLISESEVAEILTIDEVIDAVEQAFREKGLGRVQMPSKVYINFEKNNGDFRVMPSYLEELDIAGVKIVNVHPNNPKNYGIPSIIATIVLIDSKNGTPLSILGGTYITAMRTGAASAIATKYLARGNSRIIGLIGTGVQARFQLLAINEVLNLEEVKAYDISGEALNKFVEDAEKRYPLKVSKCKSIKGCVKNSDVVSIATPTTSPIVFKNWISPGTHINAIGADAPGKQELDPEILKAGRIIVDDLDQAIHSGEINVPFNQGILRKRDIFSELSEIIIGDKERRTKEEEVTIFVSTGLSLQDVATATIVFKKAKARNIGKWVTL